MTGGWWAPLAAAARRGRRGKRAAALTQLASALAERGEENEAGALALEAWRAAREAGDAAAAREAGALLRRWTSRYHAQVATDPVRLAAWDAALKAAVRPGMRVLDIGTGCGILAMMAARAGAEVVGCERDLALAAVAEETVALNGLSDAVTIIAKPVQAVELAEIGGPADLVIGDVFGDSLFNFGPFALVRAAAGLATPGARVVPSRASLHAALASLAEPRRVRPGQAAGFDLSPLRALAPTSIAVDGASPSLSLRGPAAPLIDAALPDAMPEAAGSVRAALESGGGTIDGVATWLRLELAPGIVIDAAPGAHAEGFYAKPRFHAFDEAVATEAGDRLAIEAAWEGSRLTVALAP